MTAIDADLLEEFINSINEPVIVEGIKDRKALESLGIGNIVQLHSGNSMLEVVESLQGFKRVVILTDLDQKGKILRKKLLGFMNLYGIQENKKPRELFAQMRLKHVENLKADKFH